MINNSLNHFNRFIGIREMVLLEFEIAHPLLPVIVEQEIAVRVILLPGLLGADDLLDVTFQGLVRDSLSRRNLTNKK